MLDTTTPLSRQPAEHPVDSLQTRSFCHLAPNLAFEYFGEHAIVFLPEHDRCITVNSAAAHLLESAGERFKGGGVSPSELAGLMSAQYHIPPDEAFSEACAAIDFYRRLGLVLDGPVSHHEKGYCASFFTQLQCASPKIRFLSSKILSIIMRRSSP